MTDESASYRVRYCPAESSLYAGTGETETFGDRDDAVEYYDQIAHLLRKGELRGVVFFIAGAHILRFTNGRATYGAGGAG